MTAAVYEIIATPPDPEQVRQDFDDFVAALEATPERTVRVGFGFAWANHLGPDGWEAQDLTGAELRARVAAAEAAGLGAIGDDDLHLALIDLGVKVKYCHEADIHVTADDATHPYLIAARERWLAQGYDVDTVTE